MTGSRGIPGGYTEGGPSARDGRPSAAALGVLAATLVIVLAGVRVCSGSRSVGGDDPVRPAGGASGGLLPPPARVARAAAPEPVAADGGPQIARSLPERVPAGTPPFRADTDATSDGGGAPLPTEAQPAPDPHPDEPAPPEAPGDGESRQPAGDSIGEATRKAGEPVQRNTHDLDDTDASASANETGHKRAADDAGTAEARAGAADQPHQDDAGAALSPPVNAGRLAERPGEPAVMVLSPPRPAPAPVATQPPPLPPPPLRFDHDGPYLVQIAALADREKTCRLWTTLTRAHPDLFERAEQSVLSVDLADGRQVHRLRAGAFATRGDAALFCQRFNERGGSCFVTRR